jgi:two-component system NtrC family sensor kinase
MPFHLFRFLLPRSAKARLALVCMLTTTLITVGFGVVSFYLTERRLHQQQDEFLGSLRKSLMEPVALALWNFDQSGVDSVLVAQLGNSILSLQVFDAHGELYTQRGDLRDGEAGTNSRRVDVIKVESPERDLKPFGTIRVEWSDAEFKRALHETLLLALAQLVGMNLVLLAVLWGGVDRLIFQRLHRLQLALDHAATGDFAADIVPMYVRQRDEFGDITHSVNTITARLGAELEAGRQSEEEARTALNNLKNAQDGLIRAEKMAALGSLVAGVAHELNTPIGNILMVSSTQQEKVQLFSQVVAQGTITRRGLTEYLSEAKEGADLIVQSANRAAVLIQNFKQVAVDQSSDRLRRFDLSGQTAEVLAVIAHVLAKTTVRLVTALEPGIDMKSYPGPLGQVLTNLVLNAVNHAFAPGQRGTITVACERRDEFAHMTVSDNGQGILPEHLGKIFDPFFTTKLGQGGSGLGLHICHNMVYGPLHGRLTVESDWGKGTTFTMVLPCQLEGDEYGPSVL